MIQGKVVLITGASSGIGKATAGLLAARGAMVVLGARREDRLETLAAKIAETGGQVAFQKLDVTSPSENAAIVQLAIDTYGSYGDTI